MARVSQADALNAVSQLIVTAGGKIKHADLVNQLRQAGQEAVVQQLDYLVRAGVVKRAMEFHEGDSLPTSTYSLVTEGA